ncbi:hypothetical protein STANM309S_02902 [Streptomyces tanashiensis]
MTAGRRRVGKSSLVEGFIRRTGTPHLFCTAAGGTAEDDLTELLDAVARSTLWMRGDLTPSRIRERWTSRRGRAIEPLVREPLGRLLSGAWVPLISASPD